MIDIKSDKDKVIRSLQEVEFEFAQGNISKKAYTSQKRELQTKLETLEVADRVKRLQGKKETEKPLEYWTEKKEEAEEKRAKEELMKKFITDSSPTYPNAKTEKASVNKRKAVLIALLGLIFISGIGFGIFLMKVPSESAAATMNVDQSAFPVITNNTTVSNTTVSTSSDTTSSQTSTSTSSSSTSSSSGSSTGTGSSETGTGDTGTGSGTDSGTG